MKNVKKVEMKVAEYVAMYNSASTEDAKKITRHTVYDMIKNGELKAHKGPRGAWIIELEMAEEPKKKVKKYTVKEFVEAYNKKFSKDPITVPEIRKLLADGKLKGEKVAGKWTVTSSPSRRIK